MPTPMPEPITEGALLWTPSESRKAAANLAAYERWLGETRGLRFADYEDLWRWSVADVGAFWETVWDYFGVRSHSPYDRALAPSPSGTRVEGARWFTGASLNYAEHALARRDDALALIAVHESGATVEWTRAQLYARAAEIAAGLRDLGVGRGDAVVAYMPNVADAVAAALATAAIGASWSSCPPEFGTKSVIERFQQLAPKALLAVDGYTYGGKPFDSLGAVAEIQQALPTLRKTVVLPYLSDAPDIGRLRDAILWSELLTPGRELEFEPVPFDHPLWVVYSSGTTGAPKAIVHGHGGALLEHLKLLAFHLDIKEGDRFFWFSTTGWIMWNIVVSGLLLGATIVLYDGSPAHPDMYALWRMAERTRTTCFGVSAPYILGCMKAGIEPGRELDMGAMRAIGSTGAPLPPEGFAWVYERVKRDLLLASVSGGTDVLTAFIGGGPTLPVRAGEIQCRCLGCKVESFDEDGKPVVGEVGELVVSEPMPSMPVRFLNDEGGVRLHESYFDVYPDVWRHGDWLKVTESGACVIYGRSDSTLNRSGVRMGTSEFYRVVEDLPEVLDSLVIDTTQLGTEGKLCLFAVMREGYALDDAMKARIAAAIRTNLSPRHVPDEAHEIPEVPRTLNGKKLEVPVKKILTGVPVEQAVSLDALANPEALRFFKALARKRALQASPTLSKSRFQHGLQCPKRLYLESYHIELADPVGEAQQAIFDMGNAVGELARRRWPGGVLVEEPYNEHDEAVATTQALLARDAPPPLFEAAFAFENIRVRVDVLVSNGQGGVDLVEVKSSSRAKDVHTTDAAIQTYVVEGAGLSVDRVFIMRLDKEYLYEGGEHDPERLFALDDVTNDVRSYLADELAGKLPPMWETLRLDDPPEVATGPHCEKPYRCSFFGLCHRDEPEHPVRRLPWLKDELRLRLKDAGIDDVAAIPPEFQGLNSLQRRVRESVVSGRPFVGAELGPKLRNIAFPMSFLDFETFMRAVPVYTGTRPFTTIPFQWSLHTRDAAGALDHREFLNDDADDPRERLAAALLDALPPSGAIVAYSGYEEAVLGKLADVLPRYRDDLLALTGRIVDLLRIVREGYYHPGFHGSFSIKSVLPALVPELGYDDLQIADGQAASVAYLRMTAPDTPDDERAAIRANLLAYCKRDTEAMIRVYDALLMESDG